MQERTNGNQKKLILVAAHSGNMLKQLAQLLKEQLHIQAAKKKLNVKAKTTEKLGVIGQEKAIAAEVIVSVIKYD